MTKFWKWFVKNDELIRKILSQGSKEQKAKLTEHFDQFILDLGRFSWEIIDDKNGFYTFIISPNRDQELFERSKGIIEEAPELAFWTFLPAKQANRALKSFEVYDEAVNLRTFSPRQWKVAKIAMGGRFEIQVESNDFINCDLETALFAAEIALSSFLGESLFMEKVNKVVIGEDLEDELVDLDF